jgi:hypothetical protein
MAQHRGSNHVRSGYPVQKLVLFPNVDEQVMSIYTNSRISQSGERHRYDERNHSALKMKDLKSIDISISILNHLRPITAHAVCTLTRFRTDPQTPKTSLANFTP